MVENSNDSRWGDLRRRGQEEEGLRRRRLLIGSFYPPPSIQPVGDELPLSLDRLGPAYKLPEPSRRVIKFWTILYYQWISRGTTVRPCWATTLYGISTPWRYWGILIFHLKLSRHVHFHQNPWKNYEVRGIFVLKISKNQFLTHCAKQIFQN